MTTLTLVAVLQMNMKTSKTSIEEATLIETALTACFGYWAFLSCFIYCAVYVCSSYINTIQVVTRLLIIYRVNTVGTIFKNSAFGLR